jgi:hypothetical protein
VRAPHMLLRYAAMSDSRLKLKAMFRRNVDSSIFSHKERSNCFGRFGTLNGSDHCVTRRWNRTLVLAEGALSSCRLSAPIHKRYWRSIASRRPDW